MVKVFLAGRVAVETDGVVFDERRFPGRQGRLLFAYLVAEEGRAVPRGELAEALWGEEPPSTWAKALSVLVSKLRVLLGENGIDGASALTGAFGCYRLELPEGSWVDVLAAASAAHEAEEALAAGEMGRAKAAAALAESLVRQPFLPGDDGTWVEEKRRKLTEVRARALTALADASLRSGDARDAAQWAEQAIALEPFRESGYRRLMEADVAAGDRAEALRVYDRCRRLLAEELGAYPSPETELIYRALLEAPPPPSRTAPPQAPPSQTGDHEPVAWQTEVGIGGRRHRQHRSGTLPALTASGALLLAAAIAAGVLARTGRGAPAVRAAANTVAMVDASTDRVAGAIPVGARPGAIVFGAGSLWVANVDDQSVSRVDPRTLRTLRTIPLDDPPTGIAAADGGVWVVGSSPSATFASVTRIDPQFDVIDRTVRVGNVVPGSPAAVAARAGALWVAPFSGELTRLNTRTGGVITQVDPNAALDGVDLGAEAEWATDSDADTVVRVDPTGLVTAIAVGHSPSGIAVGDGGVWVADTGDDAVVRIDPGTRAVTATIPVGQSPAGVAIGAGSVWVANGGDGTVTRINPETGRVTATITVGGSPQAIAVAGGRAWVTIDQRTISSHQPASGGTLRLDSPYDVTSMDPALADDGLAVQLLYATCAKLLNYPDKPGPAGSQLVPEVAQSLPERSAGGRSYTFKIRSGFRFSPPSNEPVTAQTFKYTIERTLNPRMRSPVAGQFRDIAGASAYMAGKAAHIAGLTARANTLTIRLTAPAPDLPARITEPAFCAVPSGTPIDPKGVRVIPSAGPYRVSSDTPGQGIVVTRNPNYHAGRPHRLQRIEVTVGIPGQRVDAQVQAGTADYADYGAGGEPAGDAATLAARYGAGSPAGKAGHQQYFVNPQPQLDFFALNTHRPLFADTRLRQAVNYAIDRRALARLGDEYSPVPEHPTDHYLPPGIPGYSTTRIYPLKPDLAKARALAKGRATTTAVLYTCDQAPCVEQAQIIKTDLAAIGLRVEVKAYPDQTLYAKTATPGEPFDIAWIGWIADYPDPSAILNVLLEDRTIIPTFNDPTWRARLAAAAQLAGPKRYLTYAKLDHDLARHAAPLAAFGNLSSYDFFSARIGCQTYGIYGMDLASLCLKHSHS